MATIQPSYSFNITREGDTCHFEYAYSKPSTMARILNTILFSVIAFGVMSMGSFLFIMMGLAVLGAGIYFFHFSPKRRFSITPTEFIVGDKRYDRQHISKLFVKVPKGLTNIRTSRTRIFVGGSGPLGGMMTGASVASNVLGDASSALGRANAQEGAKVRFKICFYYAEKEIVLAERLSESSANALFDKIMETANV